MGGERGRCSGADGGRGEQRGAGVGGEGWWGVVLGGKVSKWVFDQESALE